MKLRTCMADGGRWRARAPAMRVEREDEFWMFFEDFMLVFSNLFVLLDTRQMQNFSIAASPSPSSNVA